MQQRSAGGGNKHGAIPCTCGEIRFASKKEAGRYGELMAMVKAGEISDLRLQPEFTLQEAYTTPEGIHVRAIRYRADFSYFMTSTGEKIIEDVKSEHTRKLPVYQMKRKMMLERLKLRISEV